MGFLDDLGKKVSDAGQKTLQKTKDVSDTVRINAAIAEEEKKINNTYYQIGKTYVAIHGNDYEEEFSIMVEAVVACEQKIRDYKKQIQDIKGSQCCEKCGAEVSQGSAFCNSCGSPMPKIQISENMEDCVKCNYCGAVMKREMRFCTSCGKEMVQIVVSDVLSETVLLQKELQEKKCPNCGTQHTDDSQFCVKCGTKL